MDGNKLKAMVGRNLKLLRTNRGYSQAFLAEKADISITYLSRIERGLNFPKPEILVQIAEGLDVEIYELFKMDHTPREKQNNHKKLINSLSKEMTQKVTNLMESVFLKYSK
jgi:transcriptional regulator with XRE-family HTH domain